MEIIRYVHASDLHLDTPFTGVAKLAPSLAQKLRNASFAALEELTAFCISEKVDFLVLAGDLYDEEDHSIKAQLKLRDACVKLAAHNIPVFIVHGNHDPLTSRFATLQLPDNTHVFGEMPESRLIERDGSPLAVIHGISHAQSAESRNLATLLKRDEEHDCFQLGVLHCNLEGSSKDGKYAPCSLGDLVNTHLDGLALGHIHNRRIVSEKPFIAYSGNTQGLHHGETGPRGCYLVTCKKEADGWICSAEFHALGPVIWETAAVNADNCATLDELENKILEALPDPGGSGAETIILDMEISGRTPMHPHLLDPDAEEDFTRIAQNAAGDRVFVRKLQFNTAPPISEKENLDRDDLLGEVARVCRDLAGDEKRLNSLLDKALAPLRKSSRNLLPPAPEDAKIQLLESARRICQDLLEDR